MNEDTNEILTIGKHKGKSYSDILEADPNYCSWVISLDAPSGPLALFRDYLQNQNAAPAKPVGRSSIDSLLAKCNDFALSGSQPPPKKKSRLSQWIENDLSLDDPLLLSDEPASTHRAIAPCENQTISGAVVLEVFSNEHFRVSFPSLLLLFI